MKQSDSDLLFMLMRWAESEPDSCKRVLDDTFCLGPDPSDVFLSWGLNLSNFEFHLLQGEVQRAIANRGWIFSLHRLKGTEPPYLASVFCNLQVAAEEASEEPAIALLQAYLKTLEAEAALIPKEVA